ncbi:hypothetical protein D3C81_1564870 [compost metagenome]
MPFGLITPLMVRASPSGSLYAARMLPLGSRPGLALFSPPASIASTLTGLTTGGSLTPVTVITNCAWSVSPPLSWT